MRRIETDILVIGGGATGTGIFRDLSMRKFRCVLVERRDLAYGTTGRYHGLLHSGARYVVKDPLAAKECIQENRILRKIMPQCIEDTGGFFVQTKYDDPTYASLLVNGCHSADIPIEEINLKKMLREEPALDPAIQRCFHVPDASADSFLAAELNAESAKQYGGILFPYHEVTKLILGKNTNSAHNSILGVIVHDIVKDEIFEIDANLVVNASGAWAGKIAGLAGISLKMLPGKGTMIALNHRIVNTVINRCKMPSDGDILVPAHSVAVMGTTDVRVADPDHYSIEPWEIRLMLDEGEKIIPRFKEYRVLRAWAGVRPLIEVTTKSSDRDISRAFVLIDHASQDGIDGLLTITSGKWTTYRKMAEATVDKVCEKLNTPRKCHTHLEPLPTIGEKQTKTYYLGSKLEKIENNKNYGELICECELVTQEEVIKSIVQNNSFTFDDIRRDVRLGMGPCQAAFCAFRVAGLLQNLNTNSSIIDINTSFKNFLQERWKGDVPVLWGQQLRQQRFNELIYINTLNTSDLPGKVDSPLAPEKYTKPIDLLTDMVSDISQSKSAPQPTTEASPVNALVIGAGLSGLTAGWLLCQSGINTKVIAKGYGATYWSTGCIDVLGYSLPDYQNKDASPLSKIEQLIKYNPEHPYSLSGIDRISHSVKLFIDMSQSSGYPYSGSLDRNIHLPTALGTLRPTCLVPPTMIAGDINNRAPMLIVGFSEYLDFFPNYIIANLNIQGIHAEAISLNLKSLNKRKFVSSTVLAQLFDTQEFRQEVIDAVRPHLGRAGRVGFPAVLGFHRSAEAIEHLSTGLTVPVFEIPGLPPSIPGMRLHNMLVSMIEKYHGSVYNGMQVSSYTTEERQIRSVISIASARNFSHPADKFILATGGILGGGITITQDGYAKEAIFEIPVILPEPGSERFEDQFLSTSGHPIFSRNILVDPTFQPCDKSGKVYYDNLYAIGSGIGRCDPIRERSMEGIALSTGLTISELLYAQ